jgi:hypothetical protein
MESNHSGEKITARELYPNLPEGQLQEAEENLCRYFRVALQIHQGMEHAPTVLDGSLASPKMEERSNPSLKI